MTDTTRITLEAAQGFIAEGRNLYLDGDRPVWEHDAMLAQIDEALAEQQQQAEPVAWRYKDSRGNYRYVGSSPTLTWSDTPLTPEPLYTHPPTGAITAEHHQRAVAEVRRQALEDAGRACINSQRGDGRKQSRIDTAIRCAAAIGALRDQAPQPAEPTEAQIVAAAKELCLCHCEGCGVDPVDTWQVYGEQFRAEATRTLRAAFAAKEE